MDDALLQRLACRDPFERWNACQELAALDVQELSANFFRDRPNQNLTTGLKLTTAPLASCVDCLCAPVTRLTLCARVPWSEL